AGADVDVVARRHAAGGIKQNETRSCRESQSGPRRAGIAGTMILRLLLPLLVLSVSAFGQSAADVDARHRKLSQLVDEIWEHRLASSPEYASVQGDRRWNDRLTDRSAAAVEASAKQAREFLARANAIPTKGLDQQDASTKTIVIQQLRDELEDFRLKSFEMPITQFTGVHLSIPQYAPLMPFATEKDFTAWIART